MSQEITKTAQTELIDKRIQDEADQFLTQVLAAYKASFGPTNDAATKLIEDPKALAIQLFEYATSRRQITDQSNKKKVLDHNAKVLLNRLKFVYDTNRGVFKRPSDTEEEEMRYLGAPSKMVEGLVK